MKQYKFITIERINTGEISYVIRNIRTRTLIGGISFYGPWRQWVLDTTDDVIWSADCLEDVIDFIKSEIPKATT